MPLRRLIATVIGVSAFGGYIAWNIWWLSHGAFPPSVFRYATGLPAPTTGGTRSFAALCHGEIASSLHFNPMTLPIVVLVLTTLVLLVVRRGSAPGWCGRAWVVVLAIAWIVKLLSPVDTW